MGLSETFDITLVAVAFTIFFFVSPFGAAIKIHQAKDAGDFSAAPSILAALCAITQVYYALVCILREHDGNALWLNFGVNLFGFIVQEGLLVFHYMYNRNRQRVILQNIVMLGLSGGFFLLLELALRNESLEGAVFQWWKPQPTYLNVCSMVAVVANIAMYAGPLAVMGTVMRTRSVQFMPILPSVFVVCASSCWMTEGFLLQDITFWLPNLLGLILGIFQIALYAIYCRSTVIPTSTAGLMADSNNARQISLQTDQQSSGNQV